MTDKMSNGTKLALGLGAVAGVGVFLFSRSSKASTDTKSADDGGLKELSDATSKGCSDGAADKAAGKPSKVKQTTGFEDSPTTPSSAYDKAYRSCYDLGSVPVTDKGGDTPKTGGGSTTVIFSPDKAKDKVRAHSLAYAIGHSPPVGAEPGCADSLAIGGRSYCSLASFASYPPNAAGLVAFQDAAGLTPDGKVGPQTQAAFEYWFSHTS